MKKIDGVNIAKAITDELKIKIVKAGISPKLAIVAVNPDRRASAYINAKRLAAREARIDDILYLLNNPNLAKIEKLLSTLSSDPEINGIILQLPLPDEFDTQALLELIDSKKDVDGITNYNQTHLVDGKGYFTPATVLAIEKILEGVNLDNNCKIAIIGHSILVGKPLKKILTHRGLLVSVADESTNDLTSITKSADVIISAVGKAGLINAAMVKDGVVAIDVGICETEQGLAGDFDKDIASKARYFTPVPGGVGPITVAMLLSNTYKAAKLQSS